MIWLRRSRSGKRFWVLADSVLDSVWNADHGLYRLYRLQPYDTVGPDVRALSVLSLIKQSVAAGFTDSEMGYFHRAYYNRQNVGG